MAESLSSIGNDAGSIDVRLSNELVQLLSEQLYQSPLKAVEELVVNSYDADATECRVFVPGGEELSRRYVVVYDDGDGMDETGLRDLWRVGRSNKREEEIERRARRKQIGKFGIGKLATYSIANKITYLTKKDGRILAVTLDFSAFSGGSDEPPKPVQLEIRRITDVEGLAEDPTFTDLCGAVGVDGARLLTEERPHWTFSVLEQLKKKADAIRVPRLRWVLSTAMPLTNDFKLFLNSDEVASSKAEEEPVVSFAAGELPEKRLSALEKTTGEKWEAVGDALRSDSFPRCISGSVMVTQRSLHAGKSADLGRSHGFFIRVRNRLVNEEDPLFGLKPLSYQTFNRFRAVLEVDDLDEIITAPREGVENSGLKGKLESVLNELFLEARDKYGEYLKEQEKGDLRGKEHDRNYVYPRFVEHPIADVLSSSGRDNRGGDADDSWFYLNVGDGETFKAVAKSLYDQPRKKYKYEYSQTGRSGRLVVFDPATSTFTINAEHDLVRAHGDDPQARWLLEDMVTAETLLEVYLKEHHVPDNVIGEVLERRDSLLRSLANDHMFSFKAISSYLRDSSSEDHDLEVALVVAARALGFVAKHLAGPSAPDGVARLYDYPRGEKKITLEAKSSIGTPGLGHLDFAGLREHVVENEADGCLLVAPSYRGGARGDDDGAVARRARENRISCWTVRQLADVVAAVEARHIAASQVLEIVLATFAPEDVSRAVERLLSDPGWEVRTLYRGILEALESLEDRLPDADRTVDLVAAEVSAKQQFRSVKRADVEEAVRGLAGASQGLLKLRDDRILVQGSLEELKRRLNGQTGISGPPRRGGAFRD